MTYFPDLVPYAYGRATPRSGISDARVLHVGWLDAEHPFPTGETPAGFLDALVKCCFRPVELYRGRHDCDLCGHDALESYSMAYRDQQVTLGNGEVRVRDSDGTVYAAPTLVAHYVAAHQYQPPSPFVQGVFDLAARVHVVHGEEFARIRAVPPDERFGWCLRILEAAAARAPSEHTAAVIDAFRNATALFELPVNEATMRAVGDVQRAAWKLEEQGCDPTTQQIAMHLGQFFNARRHSPPDADAMTARRTAAIVELATEAGLDPWSR